MQTRDRSLPVRLLISLEDERLVALCLLGVEAAWKVLIERYAPLIYSGARRVGLSAPDAEDVFQEVALLLCDHLEALKDTKRLPGWLATTTRRAALRLKSRRRATPFSEVTTAETEEAWLEKEGPQAPSTEREVLALEQQWQLYQGLQKLPEKCRTLLTLLYLQSPPASYQEVEQELGIPLNSISPTRTRCLQKLKQLVDPKEPL